MTLWEIAYFFAGLILGAHWIAWMKDCLKWERFGGKTLPGD